MNAMASIKSGRDYLGNYRQVVSVLINSLVQVSRNLDQFTIGKSNFNFKISPLDGHLLEGQLFTLFKIKKSPPRNCHTSIPAFSINMQLSNVKIGHITKFCRRPRSKGQK